jgi:AhpD family alkylhydroperoxidase
VRLTILEHGHRWPAKAFQRFVALVLRHEVDDVVKTAAHRPEFFGRAFLDLVAEVLRGPSYWTFAEREHMAMSTSRLNECPFCTRVHTETTRIESEGEAGAALRPQLAAVLHFLEKVTRSPDDVVNLVFNTVNRLANAFEWAWDSDDHVLMGAKVIHLSRYKLPGFFLR